MSEEEMIVHNEKIRYRRVFDMMDAIESVKFITEEGKILHNDLCEALKIIRPFVVKSADKLIKKR